MEYDLTIDKPWERKENWPQGKWTNEVDHQQFIYNNYDCIISRNDFGSLNGFVRVPKNHVDMNNPKWKTYFNFDWVKCHNSITFGEFNEDGDFWIGFECQGYDDVKPVELAMEKYYSDELKARLSQEQEMLVNPMGFKKTYKDIEFMQTECMNIVDQLAKKKLIIRNMKHTPKTKKDLNGEKDI